MAGWSPLTEDGQDPIPGDPAQVQALRAWFQKMSDDVRGTGAELRNARGLTEWKSKAWDEFEHHLGELEGDFGKLSRSFARAASGLGTYGTALSTARSSAHSLLVQARQNPQDQTRLQQLRQQLATYQEERNRAALLRQEDRGLTRRVAAADDHRVKTATDARLEIGRGGERPPIASQDRSSRRTALQPFQKPLA